MNLLADRYRRWFEYEKDAHEKTLVSLEQTPEALRDTPGFRKALVWMAHVVEARRLWLHRMGVLPEGPRMEDVFPPEARLEGLRPRVAAMEKLWAPFLERLDDARLAQPFEYQSFEGVGYRMTVEDIMTQMFGHSWYHRGQIAMLMRSIGSTPAATDFLFWAREEIAPAR